MRLSTRVAIVLGILGAALAAQAGLYWHVQAAGPLPQMPPAQPLQEFPLDLGEWHGREAAVTDLRALYGDDHLNRKYGRADRQQTLWLWMVYSATGEDRGHHPEVCMRVAGKPELPGGRRALMLPGHDEPVQQFQFGRAEEGERLCGFYWYYTLWPPENDDITAWQRAYQRFQRRPSSLTIEVFTQAFTEEDIEFAQEFVSAVDGALQPYLPPGAVRGSKRLPVFVIQAGGPAPP